MKTAYCYDQNFILIGTVECLIDPLELKKNNVERYLLPANATFVEPPIYDSETQYVQWDGVAWSIKEIESPEPQPPEPLTPTMEDRLMAVEEALLMIL